MSHTQTLVCVARMHTQTHTILKIVTYAYIVSMALAHKLGQDPLHKGKSLYKGGREDETFYVTILHFVTMR